MRRVCVAAGGLARSVLLTLHQPGLQTQLIESHWKVDSDVIGRLYIVDFVR